MTWADAGTLFARFFFTGPVLYIALTMVLHPASFVRIVYDFTTALHNFEERYLGQRSEESSPGDASIAACNAIRAGGSALAILALLPMTGLIG